MNYSVDILPIDPFTLFKQWMDEASSTEISDPNAAALATADKNGFPHVRMVLLKSHDEDGFVFYTNMTSQKGHDLADNPNASICVFWKSLYRQVRVEGAIEQVSDQEADAYFNSRPKGSRIGAWASNQSSPLKSRQDMESRIEELEQRYKDEENIPRPEYWTGYRIKPNRFEFWIGREHRLHDRFEFTMSKNNEWENRRLYP